MYKQSFTFILLALLISLPAQAKIKIAVLDFELNDITSLPNTKEEQKRTATFKPLLEQALSNTGAYELVPVDTKAYSKANGGFGYLFHFNDLAAQLGQQAGADWIIVGQHSKPSFLFSYLMVHLIPVQPKYKSSNYEIKLKGNHEKVSQHAVNALSKKITEGLVQANTPSNTH